VLGFTPLPAPFFLTLVAIVAVYLALVEIAKSWFYLRFAQMAPSEGAARRRGTAHRVSRRASRFTVASPRNRRKKSAHLVHSVGRGSYQD
jgi:Mg2+-importing ATPase